MVITHFGPGSFRIRYRLRTHETIDQIGSYESNIAVEKVDAFIDELTEGPQLGFLGEPRVNVLALNFAPDAKTTP